MMAIVRAGHIDCLLIKSISRVSRNVLNTLLIVRELKERGVDMKISRPSVLEVTEINVDEWCYLVKRLCTWNKIS